jgi:hypothetical protein
LFFFFYLSSSTLPLLWHTTYHWPKEDTDSVVLAIHYKDFGKLLKREFKPFQKELEEFLFENSESQTEQSGYFKARLLGWLRRVSCYLLFISIFSWKAFGKKVILKCKNATDWTIGHKINWTILYA